jgi:hypothetical protein
MNYGSIVRLRGHALLPNAPLDRFYLQTDAQIRIHRRARPGFLQVLTGQLVTKQMLFLGFSFTDPNIALLFASIREAFQENGPEDYAIVMRPKRAAGAGGKKRFETEKIRHSLWVQDLQRYGIQCIEVDEYEEIDEILKAVELKLADRSVFVSGSLPVPIAEPFML